MSNAHITKMNINGTDVYVYYPADSLNDRSPVKLSFTAPCFLVYGDESYYDQPQAAAYVEKFGLDRAAAAGGGLVLLVCGSQPGSWLPADAAAYKVILGGMNPDTGAENHFGVGKGRNFFTNQEETRIIGFPGGVHLIGIGRGADFVGTQMLMAQQEVREAPGRAPMVSDKTPASVLLAGASVLPKPDGSVIPADPAYRIRLRVSAVNCVTGTAGALSVLGNGNWASAGYPSLEDGIPALLGLFNTKYLRQAERLLPVPDYQAAGIVARTERSTVKTAAGNQAVQTETHDIDYVLYYPASLDLQNGKVPLLLTFHGGGNTALFMALTSQWPEIGREAGFMVAAVDQHVSCPAEEIVALIGCLREKYPCIDPARLYANGYSMGAVKCWELMEQYPAMFAGLAPMHGSFGVGRKDIPPYVTPVFYVGGETSPLPEFPYQSENLAQRVDYVWKVNGVPRPYTPDYGQNPWWGVNGDRRYQVPDTVTYLDSVLTVELFDSGDGNCYTALAGGSREGHEIYDRNCRAAWDFLKKFSRAEDGTIIIDAE